jgi:hypothetical protein
MDGFGATCSRVPITLASNSVLLKYESPFQLFYFSGLIPWFHYIPIGKDEDVNVVIRMEEENPGTCAAIACNANRFANAYLTRNQVMRYTALLLQAYAASIDSPAITGARSGSRERQAPLLDIMVHIEGMGDTWFVAGDWAGSHMLTRHIEGVLLQPKSGEDLCSLCCTTLGADGSWSASTATGTYCGSKGRREPIFGFVANLTERLDDGWELHYSGRFVDGSVVGPVKAGEACQASSRTALNALKFQFERR